MPDSAYMGQPPANQRDFYIVKGIQNGKGNPRMGVRLGPPPNPRLTDSHGGNIIASCVVAAVFVILITGTRIVAKWTSKRSTLGWDDWLIILATLSFLTYVGLTLAMVIGGGLGQHNYNTTYSQMEFKQHAAGGTWIVNFTTVVFTKLSIICFNARLTGLTSTFWRWVHRIFFVAISIWGAFLIPWYALAYIPIPARYSYLYAGKLDHPWRFAHGNEGPQNAYVTIHIVTDWLLLAIPVYVVARLQMPLLKKLRAIVPISVGCLSAIGAIYANQLKKKVYKDQNYVQDVAVSWRYLDLVCAVIATSLPAVAAVIGRTIKLPASWVNYFSAPGTPRLYKSHISNPFASDRADDPGTGSCSGSADGPKSQITNRHRYEESGGSVFVGQGKHHDIDTDLESMPSKADSGHPGEGNISQVHLRDKEAVHTAPGTAV